MFRDLGIAPVYTRKVQYWITSGLLPADRWPECKSCGQAPLGWRIKVADIRKFKQPKRGPRDAR